MAGAGACGGGGHDPAAVVSDGPGERTAAFIRDRQSLGRRIAAALLRREGQTQWGHGQRGRDRGRRDGEGDGDGHRRRARCIQGHGPVVGTGGQSSGGHADCGLAGAGPRSGGGHDPAAVVTDGPGERAAAFIRDRQGLGGRIAAALLRGEGQTQRGHGQRRRDRGGGDGEGDGERNRGGSSRIDHDRAGIGAGFEGAGGYADCGLAVPRP